MTWDKSRLIKTSEITEQVTEWTVDFADDFGRYLAEDDFDFKKKDAKGNPKSKENHLTTNQLRKFFGEVKRQQMQGFNPTDFILLKPKLAYAVGRTKQVDAKIKDFYMVMADAISKVEKEEHFKNFIKIFEAIVAYHKQYEPKK